MKRREAEVMPPQDAVDRVTALLLEAPLSDAQIAQHLGVAPHMLQRWLERGRRGEKPYAEFALAIRRARIERPAELLRMARQLALAPEVTEEVTEEYVVEYDVKAKKVEERLVGVTKKRRVRSADPKNVLAVLMLEDPNSNPVRRGGEGSTSESVTADDLRHLASGMSDEEMMRALEGEVGDE